MVTPTNNEVLASTEVSEGSYASDYIYADNYEHALTVVYITTISGTPTLDISLQCSPVNPATDNTKWRTVYMENQIPASSMSGLPAIFGGHVQVDWSGYLRILYTVGGTSTPTITFSANIELKSIDPMLYYPITIYKNNKVLDRIIMYEKDTPTYTFVVKDKDGDVVDLSGQTIYFSVTHNLGDATNYLERECVLTDPVNGECTATLVVADSTDRIGSHYAELRNVTNGVNIVYGQCYFVIKEAIKVIA